MLGRYALLLSVLTLSVTAPATAGPRVDDVGDSSLLAWIDAFATRVRARTGTDGVSVRLTAGRGVELGRATHTVLPHLVARLPTGSDGFLLEVSLSLDGDSVWAVGQLSGRGLVAPLVIAESARIDRELEAVLGARSAQAAQGRFRLERLGTVPGGALDCALTDLDGDGGDDLLVLGVDGLRAFELSPLQGRPLQRGSTEPLPGDLRWPRLVFGWLSVDRVGVRVATSAGHRLRAPARGGPLGTVPDAAVPLRQPRDASREAQLDAKLEAGGPVVLIEARPELGPVRDLQVWPGREDIVLFVDAEGQLRARTPREVLDPGIGRVGDRILLADLDGDGAAELISTQASGSHRPDRVRVHQLADDLRAATVIFDGAFGSSIAALAAGDLDLDGADEVVLLEETEGDAVLWRLGVRP